MDRYDILKIVVGGKFVRMSFQKLDDGKMSIMGWGDSVTVRTVNADDAGMLTDFCEILLIANGLDADTDDTPRMADEIIAHIEMCDAKT